MATQTYVYRVSERNVFRGVDSHVDFCERWSSAFHQWIRYFEPTKIRSWTRAVSTDEARRMVMEQGGMAEDVT
jgi:hypothetical protein